MGTYAIRDFQPRVATQEAVQYQLDRAGDFLARTSRCRLASQRACKPDSDAIVAWHQQGRPHQCNGPCGNYACRVGALRVGMQRVIAGLRALAPGKAPDERRDFPFRLLVARIDESEIALRDQLEHPPAAEMV